MKKRKKPLAGAQHYRHSGLKPILVYVTPGLHRQLVKLADKEGRSLQETTRRALEEYVELAPLS